MKSVLNVAFPIRAVRGLVLSRQTSLDLNLPGLKWECSCSAALNTFLLKNKFWVIILISLILPMLCLESQWISFRTLACLGARLTLFRAPCCLLIRCLRVHPKPYALVHHLCSTYI